MLKLFYIPYESVYSKRKGFVLRVFLGQTGYIQSVRPHEAMAEFSLPKAGLIHPHVS